MRILTVLTYYRPHTSGLTIYAERLAKALVSRGHEVTVLTTQYDKDLLQEETQEGVHIKRLPIFARINKGVIAPTFGIVSTQLVRSHDAVLLHLPQLDAAGVAMRGRLFRKPTVITYHCDLLLPPGLFNRFVNMVVHFMNHLAAIFAHRIVAYTKDFANNSPFLTRYDNKLEVILPPVELPKASTEKIDAFRDKHDVEARKIIGMATRFASEKGVEVLLNALPQILKKYPSSKVVFAGQYLNVWGEETYAARLMPKIKEYQKQGYWEFLGVLSPSEMAMFYPNLDVLVVPSLNSTESFGLVQIEAMMNGTPVVSSNLPGVRQPVEMTGMGEVVPIGDSEALGEAILRIFDRPADYQGNPEKVRERFAAERNATAYEELFSRVRDQLRYAL